MSQEVSASASGRGGQGKLASQDMCEPAFFGLDDGAGVMRNQAAQQGFGMASIAEAAGAIQAVQAGGGQVGEVTDGASIEAAELLSEITPMGRTLRRMSNSQEESELSEIMRRYP